MAQSTHLRKIARRLAECELRVVLAESCTAGLACATLARMPGISEHLCGSAVTYRNETKAEWLEVDRDALKKPGPVSRIVAEQMAVSVIRKTAEADLSVSITGHLGPNAPARLDGRVYVGMARRTAGDVIEPLPVQTCKLQSTTRILRQREAAHFLLDVLHRQLERQAAAMESVLPLADWGALGDGEVDAVCLEGRQGGGDDAGDVGVTSGVIFPGAFHPVHDGHRRMAKFAAEVCGAPVEFEVSIANVDKPTLRRVQAAQRAAELLPHGAVWLSHAATFVEKSRIFPRSTFVVGMDTLLRIIDPRYYGGSKKTRDEALDEFVGRECRLLCFGRTLDGRFTTLADVELPKLLKYHCTEVDETRFRVDVSSRQIRSAE